MRLAALVAAMLLVPAIAAAEPVAVRVAAVPEGDLVTIVQPDGTRLDIRLMEIDAPEIAQPWGPEARQMLTRMLAAGPVLLEAEGLDRYGHTMGRLSVGGRDVSDEMVRQGGAWAFEHLLASEATLKLEAEARAAKRGLWAQPEDDIQPPREWRQVHR